MMILKYFFIFICLYIVYKLCDYVGYLETIMFTKSSEKLKLDCVVNISSVMTFFIEKTDKIMTNKICHLWKLTM